MIKHYFGFALFSFIVGTSAVIYAMFNVVNVGEVSVTNYSTYSPTKSCWKMKRQLRETNAASPVIKQAIFNLKTKQFNWELAAPVADGKIALHFFSSNANGTRYINTVFAPAYGDEYGTIKAANSYPWLNNLQSYENLFVSAELVSPDAYKYKNFRPKFDVNKVTAVMVY